MSSLYTANLQNDEVSEDAINPYVKDRCINCTYCESKEGKVYYCTLKNKFISPNSVRYYCFKTKKI